MGKNDRTIAQLLVNWGITYLGKYLHSMHLLSEISTKVSPQQVSGTKVQQGNSLASCKCLLINLSAQKMKRPVRVAIHF